MLHTSACTLSLSIHNEQEHIYIHTNIQYVEVIFSTVQKTGITKMVITRPPKLAFRYKKLVMIFKIKGDYLVDAETTAIDSLL